MNTKRERYARGLAGLLLANLVIASATAATITQTINQGLGTNWSFASWGTPAAAPTSGNNYVTPSGLDVRTPDAKSPSTFLGDQLQINGGGRLILKNGGALDGLATANLVLNGGSITYNTANGTTISAVGGTLQVAAGSVINSVAGDNTRDVWLLSSISGNANLSVGMVNSALVLMGTNTSYSGNWTVNSGRLEIGTNAVNPLGSGSVALGTNSLVFNTPSDLTLNNVISGSGSVFKRNSGTVVLTANNTFTAGLTNQMGLLVLAGSGAQNYTRIDSNAVLRVAHSAALPSGATVRVNGFDTHTARLEISNNITVNTGVPVELGMRENTVPALQNVHGNNTIADLIGISSGGTVPVRIQADAGTTLSLAGGINSLAAGTRGVWLQGEGNGLISGAISNGVATNFSLAKSGPGTWTLAGAATHSGGTVISSGRFEIASGGSLSGSVTASEATLKLNSGGTLAASDFTLGLNAVASTNLAEAGSSVSVGSGSANSLLIGYRTVSSNNVNAYGHMNLSALGTFAADVGNLLVGVNANANGAGGSASGELRLAANNSITATNILIGDSLGTASGLTSTVTLGSGSSVITTPRLTVGGRKERGMLTLGSGGTLFLTNSSGRAVLNIGVQNFSTSVAPSASLMDVSGGTFVASLDTLTIGLKSGGNSGGDSGSLVIGSSAGNDINANAVVIGSLSGAGSGTPVGQGTLTFGGGSFRVNNDVTLGSFSGSFGSASGTLNINGGTFAVAGHVMGDGGVSTVIVNNGVLELQPVGDGAPGNLVVDTLLLNGTLNHPATVTASNLSGSGAIANPSGVVTALGALAPGGNALGTLTVNGSLTLGAACAATFQINKSGSTLSSDRVTGITSLDCAGTLNVTLNAGSDALAGGESFTLFSAANYGSSLPVAGDLPLLPTQTPALNWYLGNLTNNGTITVNRAPQASAATLGAQGGRASTLQIIGGKRPPLDADGIAVVVASVSYTSGNGAEVTTDGTSVTYLNNTSFIGTDSFDFTVSDGRGGIDTRTITVTVTSGTSVSPNIVYGPAVDSGTSEFVIRFAGIPGCTYTVETNANAGGPGWHKLGNFTAGATNEPSPFGPGIFEVRDAIGVGSRFFRTTYPPY